MTERDDDKSTVETAPGAADEATTGAEDATPESGGDTAATDADTTEANAAESSSSRGDADADAASPAAAPGGQAAFDFSRPYNISRQFEKNLTTLAEGFAKGLALSLTTILRANSAVGFKRLDLKTYEEYHESLPDLTAVSIVTLAPLNGHALVQFDLTLLYTLIMRLMGGNLEPEQVDRKFTDIEKGVGRLLTEKLLEQLVEGAEPIVELRPEFVLLENNAAYLNTIAAGESVLLLEFELSVNDLSGPLVLCIPLTAFESVWDLFDPQDSTDYRTPEQITHDRRRIFELLQGAEADVVVKLADIDMTMEQILALSEGDTIPLYKSVRSPLVIEVEGSPMFRGLPGRLNQSRAVKIIERLNEEEH